MTNTCAGNYLKRARLMTAKAYFHEKNAVHLFSARKRAGKRLLINHLLPPGLPHYQRPVRGAAIFSWEAKKSQSTQCLFPQHNRKPNIFGGKRNYSRGTNKRASAFCALFTPFNPAISGHPRGVSSYFSFPFLTVAARKTL